MLSNQLGYIHAKIKPLTCFLNALVQITFYCRISYGNMTSRLNKLIHRPSCCKCRPLHHITLATGDPLKQMLIELLPEFNKPNGCSN